MYLNLMFLDRFLFELSWKHTHTLTHTCTHTHAHTQTHNGKNEPLVVDLTLNYVKN